MFCEARASGRMMVFLCYCLRKHTTDCQLSAQIATTIMVGPHTNRNDKPERIGVVLKALQATP